MRITETEMSNSDTFSLELVGSTPYKGVLDRMTESVRQLDGFVCVFDTPVSWPSLSSALWTGVVTSRRGDRGYAGTGLASLLQASNDLGLHGTQIQNTAYQSWTLATWINAIIGSGWAGITKGTITTTGLSSFNSWWLAGLGAVEVINAGCSMAGGAVWAIDPAGEFIAGPRATVFGVTPTVIVTQDVSSGDDTLRGVRGGVTGLVEDASEITSQVIAYGSGQGLQIPFDLSAVQNVARGLDGAYRTIRRPVDANAAESATDLARVADEALALNATVSKSYQVTASDPIRSHVRPGDTIYVWDPDLDVVGTVDVQYQGRSIRPVATIVRSMQWNTHADQGVWLYRPNEAAADQWTNLTDYAASSGGETMMVVGDSLSPANVATILGPERYYVNSPATDPLLPGSVFWLGNPDGSGRWPGGAGGAIPVPYPYVDPETVTGPADIVRPPSAPAPPAGPTSAPTPVSSTDLIAPPTGGIL